MFLARFFHNLPEPVLGAIVLMAASHLVRVEEMRQLRFASRAEFRVSLIALFGVLLFGLLDGLLLAAAGSLIMLIAFAARPIVVVLGREPVTGRFVARVRHPQADDTPGALVVRSAGAWLYFNVDHTRRQIMEMVDKAPPGIKKLVLDFSIVPSVDVTTATTLGTLARWLASRGISLELAELRDDVAASLKAFGAERDLGAIAPHRTIDDCLAERGK